MKSCPVPLSEQSLFWIRNHSPISSQVQVTLFHWHQAIFCMEKWEDELRQFQLMMFVIQGCTGGEYRSYSTFLASLDSRVVTKPQHKKQLEVMQPRRCSRWHCLSDEYWCTGGEVMPWWCMSWFKTPASSSGRRGEKPYFRFSPPAGIA